MTETQTDLRLTVERRIKAPVEKVYQAWLEPATLSRVFSNVQGVTLTKVETDPRVGGRFILSMHNGETDNPHTGTYLELTPHSRIVFTWESHSSTVEGSTVTLDFRPDGDATQLTLTHVRFASDALRDRHVEGWSRILAGMSRTEL